MRTKLKAPLDPNRWRRWFAWYPVTVWHGGERCTVWLETVERRPYFMKWEYRDVQP